MLATHCKRGHLLSGDNLSIHSAGVRGVKRSCKACNRLNYRSRSGHKRRGRRIDDPKTHCIHGHEFTPENTYVEPSGKIGCRACRRRYTPTLPPEAQIRAVIDALREGRTLQSIYGKPVRSPISGPRVIKRERLKAFRIAHPKVDRLISSLAKDNAMKARRHWRDGARTATPFIRSADGVMVEIYAAIPQWIQRADRDDIASMIYMDICEGRLPPSKIADRIGEYLRRQRQTFSQFVPVIGGRMASLDERLFDDSGTTLADTVTRGLWQ